MSKQFRKGDVATLEVTVHGDTFEGSDRNSNIKIKFPPYHDAYVDPSQLTMKRPSIVVGDTIKNADERCGVVLAIADDHAWVDLGGGDYATWWLAKVDRVDPETDPAPVDNDPKIVMKHENIAGGE